MSILLPIHQPRETPGQQLQKLTGRDYLSYSQISMFQSCPLKWHFAYVEQAKPETVSAALLFGSAIHKAIQYYYEAELASDPRPNNDDLMTQFKDAWESEAGDAPIRYSGEGTATSLESTARSMLKAFLDSPHSRPQGSILGIEESLRVSLDGQLPDLLAKVDLMELTADHLVVTDFKTARSRWSHGSAEEHGEQLILYGEAASAIAYELNVRITLRFMVITKTKVPKIDVITVSPSPRRAARTAQVMKRIFEAMMTGVVYPAPSPLQCPTCQFLTTCKNKIFT